MSGNEAFARGAWEAGVKVAAAYPGTPSTEIMENMATYPADDVKAQWSTNEKVAADVAIGASFAGVRALTAMKHVGMNVASDALMSQSYIGVNGGLVAIVCDDPGIYSSQNEQDTRLFGQYSMIPVLEPCDSQEALDYTKWAFEISEQFDTPVIVRSTTRLSHSRAPVILSERVEVEDRPFVEDTQKNVMIPSHARLRHPLLIEREAKLREYFSTTPFSRWEKGDEKIGGEIGIITMSTPYSYVREVLPGVSILKLAASYPLATDLVSKFCKSVKRILVIEEREALIESQVRAMGFAVEGKEHFPRTGDLSPGTVRAGLEHAGILEPVAKGSSALKVEPIIRPPVLCAGCPHTSCYMALRALDVRVAGDIGCYTLAAVAPLKSIDTCVAMGSSIANAVGMAKAGYTEKPIVATIGDSTFLHSGIPPLIDAVYNQANITVILLDNHITAMTGGQEHPGTGKTLRGDDAHRVDFEEVIRAVGVKWVEKVDSYDVGAMYQTFREATEHKGVSVIISDRPCVLDPVKIRGPVLEVVAKNCVACQSCMNLGCPALSWSDEWYEGHHKVKIDPALCMGCTLCSQLCPADALRVTKP
jgi:indolepyruvate ferredoxin oxidoreductase alpha subunit